ncbi:LysR family transcriptional regulator [Escherichia coli]
MVARLRAKRLQPPLSQQIQILEQQVGARLFARTNRSVKADGSGAAVFLADSRQILLQVNRGRRAGEPFAPWRNG